MPYNLINIPDEVKTAHLAVTIVDHFEKLDTNRWNTVEGDAGASVGLATGSSLLDGAVAFATTSDNEEAYLASNEIAQYILDKPMLVTCRLQYAEANTNALNVAFGFSDGVAANWLQDNGAGPKATFDGALFYKVDGETNWHFLTSDGTTKIDTTLDLTAGGSSFQSFAILIEPTAAGTYDATPLVDTGGGNAFVQIAESGANARNPLVKHTATFTTPTEMAVACGIKQGSASAEALLLGLVTFSKKL